MHIIWSCWNPFPDIESPLLLPLSQTVAMLKFKWKRYQKHKCKFQLLIYDPFSTNTSKQQTNNGPFIYFWEESESMIHVWVCQRTAHFASLAVNRTLNGFQRFMDLSAKSLSWILGFFSTVLFFWRHKQLLRLLGKL